MTIVKFLIIKYPIGGHHSNNQMVSYEECEV